ncbi:aspartate carbamoyltransferase catalytic subunit [Maritimibacter sp. UBA3975]|uniref:aspartate carbamoyltransferase catalytic subunit n=1 Tax=Maritimibacter sp. UBA3975 TaxID=1946833 RepID=UPI000C0970B3|nr:aspartate carbamoyltransferase catalytic subunit [Maritimibacter sp. UBA3975]MAM62115.1 aspartate carbamoyltransferase catalytic subunit [Maritimibacter sp.]|tara:strand:- start:13956 stop:14513 length:558 start_codon:yes stop_codon:yes gene_type:complete
MSVPAGWEGILDDGEEILWQGRPDQDFHMGLGKVFTVIFGVVFAGFALFWMVMASSAGGMFWMFGLIHFSVGVGMIFWSIYGSTYSRRNTWYTLTDRRAIVATNFLTKGKSLKSYPINAGTTVEFRAGPPDTIIFAHEERRGNKGRRYTVPVGFERLPDGHEVMRLIRKRIHGVSDPSGDTGESA